MLKLFTGTIDTSKLTPTIKRLRLFVWEENGEVLFTYGPKSSVDFGDAAQTQQFVVTLHSDEMHSGHKRFHISHFTADTLRHIDNISHIDHANNPTNNHPKTTSLLTGNAKEIAFDLSMKKGDSFYINLIVSDRAVGGRLISCDPQVENGSKT